MGNTKGLVGFGWSLSSFCSRLSIGFIIGGFFVSSHGDEMKPWKVFFGTFAGEAFFGTFAGLAALFMSSGLMMEIFEGFYPPKVAEETPEISNTLEQEA